MEFVITEDGSKTLFHTEIGEHYHSKHGALQESRHVFLASGLHYFLEREQQDTVAILEVGFGTGLNFLLTADDMTKNSITLEYCGIEAFPLDKKIIFSTGYEQFVSPSVWSAFEKSYEEALKSEISFMPRVHLKIVPCKVLDFKAKKRFDIIYFDAFAAIHQPEMWDDKTLTYVADFLKPGGVFVTYAITGNLKRAMKALGFAIEKVPGAPGKREMLRAVKIKQG